MDWEVFNEGNKKVLFLMDYLLSIISNLGI